MARRPPARLRLPPGHLGRHSHRARLRLPSPRHLRHLSRCSQHNPRPRRRISTSTRPLGPTACRLGSWPARVGAREIAGFLSLTSRLCFRSFDFGSPPAAKADRGSTKRGLSSMSQTCFGGGAGRVRRTPPGTRAALAITLDLLLILVLDVVLAIVGIVRSRLFHVLLACSTLSFCCFRRPCRSCGGLATRLDRAPGPGLWSLESPFKNKKLS
jgi:hypothetical protein